MYEYDFVTVPADLTELKSGRPHHDVIRQRAADGWRLIQVFAPDLPASPTEVELIFERRRSAAPSGDPPV